MDMSTQNAWLIELGDMGDDQLALLHEIPEINCFDDIIPDQNIAAVLQGMDMNSQQQQPHQSLSSSTDSSVTTLTSFAGAGATATAARPSKQRRVQNSSSSSPPCLPVILNFGSASSMPDDDYHRGNVAPVESRRQYNEVDNEEKQKYLANGCTRSKADGQTPAKRKSSVVKAATASRDHVLSERRRREKITQHLIALSALLPGLKKMDKSSVLGEAIKHIKQLQERVKNLEEDNGRKMVESGVLVKQSQVALEDDDLSSSGDNVNEDPSKTNSYQDEDFLSGIDVRVWKNNLLLKLQCERQEAILPKILSVLEKNHLLVSTVHVTPFGDKNFDITIIAQMDKEVKPQNVVGDLSCVIKGF
uniref:BHLH domain-containing protein n=1 Tax=Opuntia streptacantha TaxID=393608 RepID=A0A7C9FJG0_OPUST